MKKMNYMLAGIICGAVILTCFCGCNTPRITETGRSAIEQFLISTVVDLGIGNADFKKFSGKKAFIEYDYLAPQVDKPYVQGAFELHLAKNGLIVTRDAKEADIRIQIISGVLATDTTKFNFGTPQLPVPLPDTSLNIAIPEISLFQKLTRSGFGRFSFNVLEAQTRKPVHTIEGIEVRTSYTNWVILFLPFKSHDMKLDIKNGTETDIEFDWP